MKIDDEVLSEQCMSMHDYINQHNRRETRSLNIMDMFKVGFSRGNVLVTFLGTLLLSLYLCLGILLARSFQD